MATSYGSAGLFFKLQGNLFIKDYGTRVVRNAVKETVSKGVDIMQTVTPIDTGYLKSRWKGSAGSFTDYRLDVITNDTFYGVFVDEGTRYIKPRNFVKRGGELIEDLFLENLEKGIAKLR
jgi:hypothetical protein